MGKLTLYKKEDMWSIYLQANENSLSHNGIYWIADFVKVPHKVVRNIIVECGGFIFTIGSVLPIDTSRFKNEEDGLRAIDAINAAAVAYKLL